VQIVRTFNGDNVTDDLYSDAVGYCAGRLWHLHAVVIESRAFRTEINFDCYVLWLIAVRKFSSNVQIMEKGVLYPDSKCNVTVQIPMLVGFPLYQCISNYLNMNSILLVYAIEQFNLLEQWHLPSIIRTRAQCYNNTIQWR
jgi:hypothetical protein